MAYRAIKCQSARGASHLKDGTPCQDHSGALDGEAGEIEGIKKGIIAIVADGHGGKNNFCSQHGAKFAFECAWKAIGRFLFELEKTRQETEANHWPPSPRKFSGHLPNLVKNIVGMWHEQVKTDVTAKPSSQANAETPPNGPFRDDELAGVSGKYHERFKKGEQSEKAYGTTLLACAATEDYWFGLHIGDGKCIAFYPDGSDDLPIPWDERCFLNLTTSICDEDASEGARFYYQTRNGDYIGGDIGSLATKEEGKIKTGHTDKGMPVMVFINTDGVDDSFPQGDNDRHLSSFYRNNIALEFLHTLKTDPEKGFETVFERLNEYLPKLSAQGSGDDISIAGFIDTEALLGLEPRLRKRTEEDIARKAREKAEEARVNEENRANAEKSKTALPARNPRAPGETCNA